MKTKSEKTVGEVYQKVEIEWVDSLDVSDGWETIEHYIEEGAMIICTSVGYLIHEDEDIMILAMSHDPSNEHVGHGMTIPKVSIKKIFDLQADSREPLPPGLAP